MTTIKGNPNNNGALPSKELQKFFNKVKGIMLIPKENKMPLLDYPVMCLVLEKEMFINFIDYGISKIMVDLLDDKYPILSIRVDEQKSNVLGLSITDKDTGLTFKLPDQPLGDALLTFLQATNHDEKIAIMLGCFDGGSLAFDSDIKKNILLVLDGYVFE